MECKQQRLEFTVLEIHIHKITLFEFTKVRLLFVISKIVELKKK